MHGNTDDQIIKYIIFQWADFKAQMSKQIIIITLLQQGIG